MGYSIPGDIRVEAKIVIAQKVGATLYLSRSLCLGHGLGHSQDSGFYSRDN